MRVYVMGSETCSCEFPSLIPERSSWEPVLFPRLGAAWQIALDFPGALEAVRKSLGKPTLGLFDDYKVLHKRYESLGKDFAILHGYYFNSGPLEQDLLFQNIHALETKIQERDWTDSYPIQLYGPPELSELTWLPKNWEVVSVPSYYDPKSEMVLGIWTPVDTKMDTDTLTSILDNFIAKNGPVRDAVCGYATPTWRTASYWSIIHSIPLTMISSRACQVGALHSAAEDKVTNPEITTPIFERATDILCLVDSEIEIPAIFSESTRKCHHLGCVN